MRYIFDQGRALRLFLCALEVLSSYRQCGQPQGGLYSAGLFHCASEAASAMQVDRETGRAVKYTLILRDAEKECR